jgi:hypothetical protein
MQPTYRLIGRVQIPQAEVRGFQQIQVTENCIQDFLTRTVILKFKTKHRVNTVSCQINDCFFVYVTVIQSHKSHNDENDQGCE